jgi:hypothetical protein
MLGVETSYHGIPILMELPVNSNFYFKYIKTASSSCNSVEQTVTQMIEEFPAFYETLKFIAMLTTIPH